MSEEPRTVAVKPLEGAELKAALDLVARTQATRITHRLAPGDVPHILLPYQARWHADKATVRICEKSRRIGFSWGALAAESTLEAATDTGCDQFYMGYNMGMAAEFIGDCAFFAKAYGKAVSAIEVWRETVVVEDERRDITIYKVRIGAHKIEALSSNPHNWRARQGHAIIDEAAFHKALKEVIKGALAFKMWGGRISIVSTHNGEDNDFFELLRDVMAGKLPWSLHRVTFDDALRQGFYRRVCLVKGWEWSREAEDAYRIATYADYPSSEDAAEELDCVPKRGSGAYFSRMLVENCQAPDIPILRLAKPAEFVLDPERLVVAEAWCRDHLKPVLDSLPNGHRTALGQDFGRDGDLSGIVVYQEENPQLWPVRFALEMRRIPFDVQQLILFFIIDNLPLFHHAKFDSRGNGQSHAEAALQKFGPARVECVMLTASWYGTWFPRYRRAYEDRSLRAPQSEDWISDHRQVVMHKGVPAMSEARVKGSDGEDRHGDLAVAGVLGWAALREEVGGPIEVTTAGPRPSATMLRGY